MTCLRDMSGYAFQYLTFTPYMMCRGDQTGHSRGQRQTSGIRNALLNLEKEGKTFEHDSFFIRTSLSVLVADLVTFHYYTLHYITKRLTHTDTTWDKTTNHHAWCSKCAISVCFGHFGTDIVLNYYSMRVVSKVLVPIQLYINTAKYTRCIHLIVYYCGS